MCTVYDQHKYMLGEPKLTANDKLNLYLMYTNDYHTCDG